MFTKTIKPKEIDRKWYIIDAKEHVLGRLASVVATVLQGKNRAYYSPQWDMGDYVIVLNSKEVKLTGRKMDQKVYYHHTEFPGGIRGELLYKLQGRKPNLIIEKAVKRMLPKNKIANDMLKKLRVFEGEEHPHAPQKPIPLVIKQRYTDNAK